MSGTEIEARRLEARIKQWSAMDELRSRFGQVYICPDRDRLDDERINLFRDYSSLDRPRQRFPQIRRSVVHAITAPEPLTKRARRRLKGK